METKVKRITWLNANALKSFLCVATDLPFNIFVPVKNFHSFTFKTQECEAISADGDKSSQIFKSNKTCLN